MPSRFAFFGKADEIKKRYNLDEINIELYEYYNVKPTNRTTGIINDGKHRLVKLRWGFVKGNKFFKARAESITEKKLFAKAFNERRCVILANGFFEWDKDDEKSTPYYFKMKDDQLFAIAGVYNSHIDKDDGLTKYQTAVITVESNELVNPIFHRMPAIIPQEYIAEWLDNSQDSEAHQSLLEPYDADLMESYIVDTLPSRGDNGPATIARKPESTSLDDFF